MGRKILHFLITGRKKEIPFIIFFWFLLSFVVSRGSTWLMEEHIIPHIHIYIKDIHVHHFDYAIIILALIGFISLSFHAYTKRHLHGLAALYGIGLGIAFDEFGMWLLLQDNYWARQSYDAVLVITLVLLNIIYFQGFWLYLGKKVRLIRHTNK